MEARHFLKWEIYDSTLFCFMCLSFPQGGDNSVADLSGDAPGLWEGVEEGIPPSRIWEMGALDGPTRPDPQGVGG